jgi:hypothetical protein
VFCGRDVLRRSCRSELGRTDDDCTIVEADPKNSSPGQIRRIRPSIVVDPMEIRRVQLPELSCFVAIHIILDIG